MSQIIDDTCINNTEDTSVTVVMCRPHNMTNVVEERVGLWVWTRREIFCDAEELNL